jgi:hypothetical protein
MRRPVLPYAGFLSTFLVLAWLLRASHVEGKFAALAVASLVWWVLAVRVSRQQ